ncbi:FAD-dependent oxidoreductase [Paracoccus sp. DMF-8]|uniref:NAD(P)/FAD-dependent oxidoreductase n=1 Tax=Paracoccus sp. DMF-8 TaxID=3019445 RepID=UPI0023E383CB|nr:FAD-dependent oxidoreductase [Paracoccus sp. DMF-8]MDF3607192.1 FAD-dependent oxidoreductase [Paracoccus sp. DMF-8]
MTRIGGPISLTDPVRFSDDPPRVCDVVIIGGGIAGVMTGLYLTRAGLRVFLCEKGRIAAEQSSRNWGWVRQQGRDPAELPIMIRSLRLWERLDQGLGAHVGLVRGGVTYLAEDEATMARYQDWLAIARDHGLDTRLVDRAELDAVLPNASGWIGGLTTPSDARAEPWTAVPAIAAMAHAEGLGIAENCAARTVEVANGAVTGVHHGTRADPGRPGVIGGQGMVRAVWRECRNAPAAACGAGDSGRDGPTAADFEGAADSNSPFAAKDGNYTLAPKSNMMLVPTPCAI